MAGGSKSRSRASDPVTRKLALEEIQGSKDYIQNLFQQSQQSQLDSIDAAIANAQGYSAAQANARAAGQGLGTSNIGGTLQYILGLLPQAMQLRSQIYGDTAQNQAGSLQNYLQLLNQNAALGATSKGKSGGGLGNLVGPILGGIGTIASAFVKNNQTTGQTS